MAAPGRELLRMDCMMSLEISSPRSAGSVGMSESVESMLLPSSSTLARPPDADVDVRNKDGGNSDDDTNDDPGKDRA